MNYDRTVFWLKRRIRELEIAEPSSVDMARAGLDYSQRRAAYAQHNARASEASGELAAMREALECVRLR